MDLDTARLWLEEKSRPTSRLKLDCRCVPCHYYNAMSKLLGSYGLMSDSVSEGCTERDCKEPSFYGVGKYPQHISHFMARTYQAKRVADPRRAMEIFNSATRKTWTFPSNYRKVLRRIDEIQQGHRHGSELVILDDEYSPSSQQLWEFAIIERVSGRTLINTTIEHQTGIDHNELKPYPFMKWLSRSKASAVFSPSRLPSIDRMTVHQVASKLKQVGITQDTIVLVYQAAKTDLRLLRELWSPWVILASYHQMRTAYLCSNLFARTFPKGSLQIRGSV